jgi:zinc protease
VKTSLSAGLPLFFFAAVTGLQTGGQAMAKPSYAIVVSQETAKAADWKQVVETLVAKHRAVVITYVASVEEAKSALQQAFPRHVCFVAPPEEASKAFVGQVHRLTRQLDADPYTDCLWGIVTGYDAAGALRIAKQAEPLTIRKVAAGTEFATEMVDEGVWYCELNQGKVVKKEPGKDAAEQRTPSDTTKALVDTLNDGRPDLFITSGHATERDWQIGFGYRNGSFRCADGQLFGQDTRDQRFLIRSSNPKVYLPIGNCLMGNIDRRDCLALAWMNSGGVHQMLGYTVPTWYGYMGWGVLDYFVEQPGRYTFAEAFFANHHALLHRLATYFPDFLDQPSGDTGSPRLRPSLSDEAKAAGLTPSDAFGLVYDRDVVAFYGDPAWQSRMADQPKAYEQTLTRVGDTYIFEIKPNRGARSFQPINTNGSQRGGRPFVAFLPQRITDVRVIEGADLRPVITDDFILVPNPRVCDPENRFRVVFQGRPL